MRIPVLAFAVLFSVSASGLLAQETPQPPAEVNIAPPGDLNLEIPAPPAETVPQGNRVERGDRILPRRERASGGGRLFRRGGDVGIQLGDRGLSFGLDMAHRGINFGLRFADGQVSPEEAKDFGLEMRDRGRAFGFEMRDEALDLDLPGEIRKKLPVDGRDAKFEETPRDITIDAPPLPGDAARPQGEAKSNGRNLSDRTTRFRREF